MKYRGGESARPSAQGGNQAGLVQRLKEQPFPRSDVINLSQSEIVLFMDKVAQEQHNLKQVRGRCVSF